MREVAVLLNAMRDRGVVTDYALFGAAAQMRYTEPVATLDADVLVAVPAPTRIDVLGPINDFCRARGYETEGESVRVGAWPVQFIPVFSALTRHALAAAETADFAGVPFRVVDPAYLAVIALSVGSGQGLHAAPGALGVRRRDTRTDRRARDAGRPGRGVGQIRAEVPR